MTKLSKNQRLSKIIQEVNDESKSAKLQKFSINIYERTDKVSVGKSMIYVCLKYGKKSVRRSLQIECERGKLDTKNRIIFDDTRSTSLMQSIIIKIEKYVTDFRLTERELDPNLIINLVFKECDLKDENPTFYDVLEVFLKQYRELEGVEYSRKTVNKFENSVKHIEGFLIEKFGTKQVPFAKFRALHSQEFIHFCKTKLFFCTDTIRKLYGLCKKVFNYGLANGYCENNPFISIKFRNGKTEIVHLTESEIKRIEEYNFKVEIYKETQDLILFQCYTGLSYIDLYILNSTQIIQNENGLKYIFARRNKTFNEFAVLLTDKTLSILQKYQNHPVCNARNTCLPVPTNQQYNRLLKEIAKIVGIEKRLTTHVLRKTFATLMVNKGLSKESLQYSLAHQSVRITEKHYAQLKVNRVLEEQQTIFKKIG
ncbi:MAG: tyrosine-type recombinase/integrase [Spirosomataceae bacterium]